MPDLFKRVTPGERLKIPAAAYNAFIDAALDYKRRRVQESSDGTPTIRDGGIVLLQNSTGADLAELSIVGIAGPIYTPTQAVDFFKSTVALSGAAPTVSHAGKFAVLLEPISNGFVGAAMVDGVCPVKVNITDANHRFADVTPSQSGYLTSSAAGSARILWSESATGNVWCIVRIGDGPVAGMSDNPAVLLSTGATANADTWAIASPPAGTRGVKFVAMRLYWTGTAGDPVKQFIRTPTYDSLGRLVAVSAEVGSDAFATGDCAGT